MRNFGITGRLPKGDRPFFVSFALRQAERTRKMKQRFRKTPTSQRKVYKYYDANERCVAIIHPGDDNQVSEIHIKILHSMDDAEVYNNCKNKTTTPVSGKARHVDVCMGFPYSSYWVLSLEWLEDEALMGSTEHRKLLAQAYSDEEQRRHDVRKELLYEAVDCLPDAEQALKIAKQLNTSIEYLVTGKNEEKNGIKQNLQEMIPKLNHLSNENLELIDLIAGRLK